MSVAIIINPISGGARAGTAAARARTALAVAEARGVSADVFVTERGGHARELAQAAVDRGVGRVIAWGGDGTINEVASALAFGGVPLGIVPAGSGNGLARELGIDPRPACAIAESLEATPRAIDLGEIDGRLFVNIAGIGFDAHVASRFAASGHRRGLINYARITAAALATYVPLEYRITSGGATQAVRAVLVTIANSGQFGNGARIAPDARIDDGLLDLVVFEERSRFATICSLPRLFTGTVDRAAGCRIQRIREATIEADAPLTFHVDGEPVQGGATVHVRVHAGALLVAI